ncbi:MAG: DNA polymerase I [Brevinematia bacterium]
MSRKIALIDGTGLLYRAYYAFISRPLTTTKGEHTSAIFGFFKVLSQIFKEISPDAVLVAFDRTRATFRQKIYPLYKAQRQETPPDLKAQIPVIIGMLERMGIKVIEMDEYEADDIIGTVAYNSKNNFLPYIVSGDKDLMQLVDDKVRVIKPQKGISEINLLDREGVKNEFGVYPEQIPDYIAIVGDASDNIPGIKGIGEKGAVKLLSEYKTLENIYSHIDEIQGAIKNKLIEGKETAFLSKDLATIRRDIDIKLSVEDFIVDKKNILNEEVINDFKHYELYNLLLEWKKLFLGDVGEETLFAGVDEITISGEMKGDYRLIKKRSEFQELLERIKATGYMSIDTETTTPDPFLCELIGISISLKTGEAYFIPCKYCCNQEFDLNFVLDGLRPVLENEKIGKIGQNLKYEWEVFSNYGIFMKGIIFDTMIAAYLLNPTRTHNNLESLVLEYLNVKKNDYSETLKKSTSKGKDITLLDVSIDELVNYACGDADAALRLKEKLEPLIKKEGLENVFYKIELPLITVLGMIEKNGVKVDREIMKKMSEDIALELERLKERIYFLAGKEFNIQSSIQLSKILFEDLGLEPVKLTEKGKASTDEEVLETLAREHPLPAEILKFRTLAKLKNTYLDSIPELINPNTNRVHTSFNQTVTATGRLSSSEPNLQNIPIRDEVGRKVRMGFIADEGRLLLSADYSQIELRVLAHFCKDRALIDAFLKGKDIHRHTASIIFGCREDEVTEDMRRRAKSVNFGIIYGLQAFGLSKQLGIPVSEAKEFIDSYFRSFPDVRNFVREVMEEVRDSGEVRTLYGRKRSFPDLYKKTIPEGFHLSASQRMALNTKIQGSAADIIKIAMIELSKVLVDEFKNVKMILQIHDELVFECPLDLIEDCKKLVKEVMENCVKLDVPLIVDIGVGKNWSEAH